MPEPDRVITGLAEEPLSTESAFTVRRLAELLTQAWSARMVTPCDPVLPRAKVPELAYMTMPLLPRFKRPLPVPVDRMRGAVTVVPSPLWMPLISPPKIGGTFVAFGIVLVGWKAYEIWLKLAMSVVRSATGATSPTQLLPVAQLVLTPFDFQSTTAAWDVVRTSREATAARWRVLPRRETRLKRRFFRWLFILVLVGTGAGWFRGSMGDGWGTLEEAEDQPVKGCGSGSG